MTDPRYVASESWQREFAVAVRKNVNAYFKERGLSTKGDWRLVVKVIAMMAMYVTPFVVLLTVPMAGWWALPLVVLMGIGLAGIGMSVMHDAVHGSASRHQWLNDLLGSSMNLIGSSVLTWRIQHNGAHHTHTNVNEVDQDIDSNALLRFSDQAKWTSAHRFQHVHAFFFYGLLTITKVFNDFFMLRKFTMSGAIAKMGRNPRREMLRLVLLKIAYFGVHIALPIAVTGFVWWQVVLGWFIMHFVSGFILGCVFQLAHVVEGAEQPVPDANNIIHADWAVHEVLTTADFAPNNRWVNWYVGGLNFQIEHHLFPHVCHVHYRALAPIVQRTAEEFGLPYNVKPTLRAALVSHARRLKTLGRPTVKAEDAVLKAA